MKLRELICPLPLALAVALFGACVTGDGMETEQPSVWTWHWMAPVFVGIAVVTLAAVGVTCCGKKDPDTSSSSTISHRAKPRVHTVRALSGSSSLARDESCTFSAGSAGWRSAGSATQFTLEDMSLIPEGSAVRGASALEGAARDPFDLRGVNDNPDTSESSSVGFYTMQQKLQRRRRGMPGGPMAPFGAPHRVVVKKRKKNKLGRGGMKGMNAKAMMVPRFPPGHPGYDFGATELEEEEDTNPTIVMAEGETQESEEKPRPPFKANFGKKERKRYRTVTRRDWKKHLKWNGKLPPSHNSAGVCTAENTAEAEGAGATATANFSTNQSATDGGRTRRGWSSIFRRSKSKTLTASATEGSAGSVMGPKKKKKKMKKGRKTTTTTATATATCTGTESDSGSPTANAESATDVAASAVRKGKTGSAEGAKAKRKQPSNSKKPNKKPVRRSASLGKKSTNESAKKKNQRPRTASVIAADSSEQKAGSDLMGSDNMGSDLMGSELALEARGGAGGPSGFTNASRISSVDKASNS